MIDSYKKIVKVIESCKTYSQLLTARKMIYLFDVRYMLKLKYSDPKKLFLNKLHDSYHQQKIIIEETIVLL